jgi:hypothetical protein
MITTFNKMHRAANDTDYESWGESDVAPTQNVFDVGDVRATTIIVDDEPPIAFNWQNGGGYGDAHDGLGITTDGVGPMTTSQVQAVAHKYTVRRLTPTECERLQGFPDGWTDVIGPKGKPQSDTQRYKQLGNAVTVNVAEYIAALIMHADENYLPPRVMPPTLGEIQAVAQARHDEVAARTDPLLGLTGDEMHLLGEALSQSIDALLYTGGPYPMGWEELAELGMAPQQMSIDDLGWDQ